MKHSVATTQLLIACCSMLLFCKPSSCILPTLYVPVVAFYSLIGGGLSVAWYGYKVRQGKCEGPAAELIHQNKELHQQYAKSLYLRNFITPRSLKTPNKQERFDCGYFLNRSRADIDTGVSDPTAHNDYFPSSQQLYEHFIQQPDEAHSWGYMDEYSVYYNPPKQGNNISESPWITLLLFGGCWKNLCDKLKSRQPIIRSSDIHPSLAKLPKGLAEELLRAYTQACESEHTPESSLETITKTITDGQEEWYQREKQIQQIQQSRRYFHTMKSLKHFAWGAAITYGLGLLAHTYISQ